MGLSTNRRFHRRGLKFVKSEPAGNNLDRHCCCGGLVNRDPSVGGLCGAGVVDKAVKKLEPVDADLQQLARSRENGEVESPDGE